MTRSPHASGRKRRKKLSKIGALSSSPVHERAAAAVQMTEEAGSDGLDRVVRDSLAQLYEMEARQNDFNRALAQAEARAAEESAKAAQVEQSLAHERAQADENARALAERDARLAEAGQNAAALQAALAQAEARAAEESAKAAQVEQSLAHERAQADENARALAERDARLAEAGGRLETQIGELTKAKALISLYETKEAETSASLAGAQNELSALRAVGAAKSAELAEMTAKSVAMEARVVSLETALARTETDFFSTRHELADLQAHHSRKLQRLAELEDDYESLSKKQAAAVEKLGEQLSRVEMLEGQVTQSETDRTRLEALLAAEAGKLAERTGEGEALRAQLADAETRCKEESNRRAASEKQGQRLAESCSVTQMELEKSTTSLWGEIARSEQLTNRVAQLENQIAESTSVSNHLRAHLAAVEARSAEDANRTADLERTIADERAKLDDLLRRAQQAEQEVTELAAALAAERAEVERSKLEINAIRRSGSWRASAPLRTVSRSFKRIKSAKFAGKHARALFDPEFYLQQYPDVVESGLDPYSHYKRFGAVEGRDPNPMFDTKWYLERYPDVRESGINPLLHYLIHGSKENRDPHPLFSTSWYLQQNPEVGEQKINPLQHYLAKAKNKK